MNIRNTKMKKIILTVAMLSLMSIYPNTSHANDVSCTTKTTITKPDADGYTYWYGDVWTWMEDDNGGYYDRPVIEVSLQSTHERTIKNELDVPCTVLWESAAKLAGSSGGNKEPDDTGTKTIEKNYSWKMPLVTRDASEFYGTEPAELRGISSPYVGPVLFSARTGLWVTETIPNNGYSASETSASRNYHVAMHEGVNLVGIIKP
jgi:hypothetical protein